MNRIKLAIKLFDASLPVPEYQTSGAAGFDLYSRENISVDPHSIAYIPLNIAIQLPEGYWALLAARSSLHKQGLMMANGIGVGDYDYRGDGDEYKAALYNFSHQTVTIEKGQRIVQMIIMPATRSELQLETTFSAEDRGGFGSTGN